MSKELRSLLEDFNSMSSDWSKGSIWLGKVKSLVAKDPSCISPEKYTLAKRLAQCLHPHLLLGVHKAALEIYDLIFKSPDFIEDFALFSGGILPFFEYASKECKILVLQIIIDDILFRAEQLTFAFPGIVCSLLPGFRKNEEDLDIDNKIIQIFDGIAYKDKQGLYGAVWQALLRSPRIRLQALCYLALRLPGDPSELRPYLPQKNLMINALIASMNGPSHEVQQATIELLCNHFPVEISNEIFLDNERGIIVENVFKLLLSPHEKIVWGWLFPGGHGGKFASIKQFALKKLFDIEPRKKEESVLPLEIIRKILMKTEIHISFLSPIIVPMLSYANKYSDSQYSDYINTQIQQIFNEFPIFEQEIWKALQTSLNDELRDDVRSTIEVTKFFLSNFRNSSEDKCIVPLLTSLLFGIRQLTSSLGSALELVQMMVNRLPASAPELSSAIKCYHLFFASLSSDPKKSEHLKLSASLLLSLESHITERNENEWIKCLVEAMHSPNTEVALTGVENIIELLKSSGYRDILEIDSESDIIIDVFERLWPVIEEPVNQKRAVELVLRMEEFDHDKFMELLKQKLLGESATRRISESRGRESMDGTQDYQLREIKKSLRIFTEFWKCTGKVYLKQLLRIFSKGDGMFIVLDYLESPSPETRQLAREWVVESLDRFECVLDPILKILLNIQVRCENDSSYLLDMYDSRITLDTFKKLKKLIRNGGEMIINKSSALVLGADMLEVMSTLGCKSPGNYLEAMLEISLLYIRTETDIEEFKKENHTVQAAAAEFLDLTLTQGNTKLAYKAVNRVLQSLKKSIEKDDGVLQLLLLNILRVIFFECKISTEVSLIKELVASEAFSEVYLGVLKNRDSYILSHWINFIVESLPMVMHFVSSSVRLDYYSKLINSLCNELKYASEKTTLFQGLKVVFLKALGIGENLEFTKTLINSSPEKKVSDKGWMKSFFSSDQALKDPKEEAKKEILKQIENVISTCLFCIEDFKINIEMSRFGVGALSSQEQAILTHPALEILNPVMDQFPNEFTKSLLEIWKSTIKTQEDISRKLIAVIISMNFKGKIFLQAINTYIDSLKLSAKNKKNSETNNFEILTICHFVCAVFSCITSESISTLAEDRRTFWLEICKLLNKLEQASSSLSVLWLVETLNLFLLRISIDEEIRDKTLKKTIQDQAQRIITLTITMSFSQDSEEIQPPFPPCLYNEKVPQMSLNLGALLTLKSGLYKIVNTLWQADSRDKGISLMQGPASQVLKSLQGKSVVLNVDLMSELMSSLICSPDTRIAEAFKREVMEFLTQTEFFESMKNSQVCFRNWCKIVNSISNACYPDKTVLVNEILGRELSGVFITEQVRSAQRGRMLKAVALVLYAGEKDVYQSTTEIISKTLIDYLKSDRNLDPLVLFTVRVLLLKLSHTVLSNVWPQLWPHLLTELMQMMQMMQTEENLQLRYAALKFLDLISAINNEEFLMYQWLFFYDSMNSTVFNNAEEFPLVNRMVGNFIPDKEIENTTGIVKRKLVIKEKIETEADLQSSIIKLCREVVRSNSLRIVPDEDSIASVIEKDFFTLEYKAWVKSG